MPTSLNISMVSTLISQNKADAPLSTALILSAFYWGVSLSELSRVQVSAVMAKDGELKQELSLTPKISSKGKTRELYTTNAVHRDALKRYIEHRIRYDIEITNNKNYLSLKHNSPLFLDPYGLPFKFMRREPGNDESFYPSGMTAYFKTLFENADLDQYGYRDLRSLLSIEIFQYCSGRPGVIKEIKHLLGISTYKSMRKILNIPHRSIPDAISDIKIEKIV